MLLCVTVINVCVILQPFFIHVFFSVDNCLFLKSPGNVSPPKRQPDWSSRPFVTKASLDMKKQFENEHIESLWFYG